jgi:hypothetical protein
MFERWLGRVPFLSVNVWQTTRASRASPAVHFVTMANNRPEQGEVLTVVAQNDSSSLNSKNRRFEIDSMVLAAVIDSMRIRWSGESQDVITPRAITITINGRWCFSGNCISIWLNLSQTRYRNELIPEPEYPSVNLSPILFRSGISKRIFSSESFFVPKHEK